jgi:hypothetical protein
VITTNNDIVTIAASGDPDLSALALLGELGRAGLKPRLRIDRTSNRRCDTGHWGWLIQRPSGMWQILGCVCHHWWTRVVVPAEP